jgi:hypothetical protein
LLRSYHETSNEIKADARQSPVNGNSKNAFYEGPCEANVELLEIMFSEQSVQRIYHEEQIRSRVPTGERGSWVGAVKVSLLNQRTVGLAEENNQCLESKQK